MLRLEFLLEEPSMMNVLKNILPKILPPGYLLDSNYFLRPHAGRSDLQKSIPKKAKVFSHFHEPVALIIVHDQHSSVCTELKKKLTALCQDNGNCPFLIRIVCQELEAWYLGDMAAIEKAYPAFNSKKYVDKAKFRDPDRIGAAAELMKILPGFQKMSASNNISRHLDIENNKSRSFNNFVSGVRRILER